MYAAAAARQSEDAASSQLPFGCPGCYIYRALHIEPPGASMRVGVCLTFEADASPKVGTDMRARRATIVISLLALAMSACGEDDPENVTVSAEPPEVAVAGDPGVAVDVEPAHGGVVVPAGPHPVEVVARPGGDVEAYFVGAEPPPPSDVELTVRVPTAEGPRPVVLIWDPSRERYRGSVPGVSVSDGPVDVVVSVGPQRYRGRAPTLVVVAPDPRPNVDVVVDRPSRPRTVVVEGPEPPRAEVRVRAPRPRGARVVVEGPAPPPPPGVVVHGPAPPPGPHVVVRGGHPPAPRGHVVVRGGHGPPGKAVGHRRHRGRGHRRGHGRGHARGARVRVRH